MNKTRDVINWYHWQSSAVSIIHKTLNLNNHKQKTSDILERKTYLEWNPFFFLSLFTCRHLDYNSSLASLASSERWDTAVIPKMRPLTSRQTWIIKYGIHLSSKAACTKQMSKFGYFIQAMAMEWTFLHPTFQQNTTNKLCLLMLRKTTTSDNRECANATLIFYQTTVAQNSFVIQWVCH